MGYDRWTNVLDTDQSLGTWIHRRARFGRDAVALEVGSRSITYGALAERIDLAAGALDALGVRTCDRAAFSGPPGLAYLETLFGATALGAGFTPVNPRLPADVAAWIVSDADARVLVRADSSSLVDARTETPPPALVALDARAVEHGAPWIEPGGADRGRRSTVPLDALALLMYTSGTTGRPKGVMLTHANLLANALNMASVVDFLASDRVMVAASFYRMGGLAIALHTLFQGGTVVIPESTEPDRLLQAMVARRPTIVFTGPEQLRAIADEPGWEGADLTALRFAFIGGSPVLGRLAERFGRRGIGIAQGYGLTEASPLILFASAAETARGLGTAGVPPMLVDVRVAHEDGNEVAPGVIGELLARGPNVTPGYWRRPDATAVAIRDGWLRTGDAAERSAEGDIRILGRVEDVIHTDRGPVTTGQIERALDGQEGVVETVAVGIPTDGGLQRPVVAVVLAPGASTDAARLEAQLAMGGAPLAATRVVVVPAIPRSAAGKPQRDAIRRMVAPVLGLDA